MGCTSCLLRSPEESLFYVFYDDNQRIYGRHSVYPVPSDHYYPLNINCRTTLTIHDEVMKHYNARKFPPAKDQMDERLNVFRWLTRAAEYKTLFELLRRLKKKRVLLLRISCLLAL